jgi:SAM-dependent methyltransferase
MTSATAENRYTDVRERASLSLGASASAIYAMVARHVERISAAGSGKRPHLVDAGCGTGGLWPFVKPYLRSYTGVDVIRYREYPEGLDFQMVDLDTGTMGLPDASADIVVAVETIEHLENPRAFVRELARVARPGGTVLITTPNQLSLLSLITLIFKKQHSAFQASDYPAHLTALLEVDLERIARECGLTGIEFTYTGSGRIAFTARHYPIWVSGLSPRLFSDNLMLAAKKVLS